MTYTKPEVSLLGDAARVIEGVPKPLGTSFEVSSAPYSEDPAYDLDE